MIALSRGERLLDLDMERQLRCRYVTDGVAFLRLQPVKEEEAYLNPRIVIYHDVLSDAEIETVKKMAQPRVNEKLKQKYLTVLLTWWK